MKDSDMAKCLLDPTRSDKFKTGLADRVKEQEALLAKIFAPIQSGPEYVSMNVYKREAAPMTFMAGQGLKDDQASPNPLWKQNAENKKIVIDALAKAKIMIEGIKTPKDLQDAIAFIETVQGRIKNLEVDYEKQYAAAIASANILNTQYAKDKIAEIESQTGKTVNTVTYASSKGSTTVTRTTIDIPTTKQLLDGSEADMNEPVRGEDPDKVIAQVQKKLEYYKGILELNRSLDDVRVRQRPANARAADAMRASAGVLRTGTKIGSAASARLSAMTQ